MKFESIILTDKFQIGYDNEAYFNINRGHIIPVNFNLMEAFTCLGYSVSVQGLDGLRDSLDKMDVFPSIDGLDANSPLPLLRLSEKRNCKLHFKPNKDRESIVFNFNADKVYFDLTNIIAAYLENRIAFRFEIRLFFEALPL
jgi:hypothetical protein